MQSDDLALRDGDWLDGWRCVSVDHVHELHTTVERHHLERCANQYGRLRTTVHPGIDRVDHPQANRLAGSRVEVQLVGDTVYPNLARRAMQCQCVVALLCGGSVGGNNDEWAEQTERELFAGVLVRVVPERARLARHKFVRVLATWRDSVLRYASDAVLGVRQLHAMPVNRRRVWELIEQCHLDAIALGDAQLRPGDRSIESPRLAAVNLGDRGSQREVLHRLGAG